MLKTWRLEMAVVAVILGAAAYAQHAWIAVLSGAAVLGSFGHAQVAERMRERQAQEATPATASLHVHCWRWLTGYLVAKELAWIGFFLLTKSWPALVGCGVFLLYPVWRSWWRKYRPMNRK